MGSSAPESALKLDNDLYQNEGTGPNLGCGPAITPLVSSKARILAAIDEMAPWHRGGTMANLGLAWGWRVLSPNWRGRWDGDLPDELPLDYETPNMEKVVILLTDGNNEWYDYPDITFQWGGSGANHYTGIPGSNQYPTSPTNWRNQFQTTWPGADYTAYGRLSEGRLGTTSQAAANSVLDDRMLDMCQTMKAQGIIIYTMTFGPSPDAEHRTLVRDLRDRARHVLQRAERPALQQAFVQIADELAPAHRRVSARLGRRQPMRSQDSELAPDGGVAPRPGRGLGQARRGDGRIRPRRAPLHRPAVRDHGVLGIMFVQAILEGSAREASRYGLTGFTGGVSREDQILSIVEDNTYGIIDMDELQIDTLVYENFGDIGQPEPFRTRTATASGTTTSRTPTSTATAPGTRTWAPPAWAARAPWWSIA